jgi:hypothetical protein
VSLKVFYTEHVDGPLGLFPFCSAYRCIVGLDQNRSYKYVGVMMGPFYTQSFLNSSPPATYAVVLCHAYSTHFPMERDVHTLATGDVLAFVSKGPSKREI